MFRDPVVAQPGGVVPLLVASVEQRTPSAQGKTAKTPPLFFAIFGVALLFDVGE